MRRQARAQVPRAQALLAAFALLACAPAEEPGAGASIPVLLDGEVTGAIRHDALSATPRSLERVLDGAAGDPSSWVMVEADSVEGRHFAIPELAAHPDAGVFLRLDAAGAPEIGLFPSDDPAGRGPRLLLTNLAEVHVRTVTVLPEPPADATAPTVLEVRIAGAEPFALTAERLAAIESLAATNAGSGTGEHQGGGEGSGSVDSSSLRWERHLGDVAAALAPSGTPRSVTLIALDGERLAVDGDVLRSRDDPLPLLKRNRRGEWVFRISTSGPEPAGFLREIVALEIRVTD